MIIVLADVNGKLIEAWKKFAGNNIIVETYNGSIFDIQCDAIVSPANSFGFMDGGIDLAISNFFGWHVQKRLQHIIRTKHHGELLVGLAEIVETDHERIPYVIAAPTMRVPMILKDSINVYLAIRAVLLLVKFGKFENGKLISDSVKNIAFPGMGTGVGRIRPEIFVKQMKMAIEDIAEEKYIFPSSWWESQKRHQLMYSDTFRDMQFHKKISYIN